MHYFELMQLADWGFLRFKAVPTVKLQKGGESANRTTDHYYHKLCNNYS